MDGNLQIQVAKYLEIRGLSDLKAACEQYTVEPSQTGALFSFEFSLDAVELLEVDASLGNLVLKEPTETRELFTQEIYKVLMNSGWIELRSIGQLLVLVRIVTVPPCFEFDLTRVDDLWSKCELSGRYYWFDGVIVAISVPTKYTLGASYLCTLAACPGSVGNKFTRFHMPGMREKQVVSDNFLCTICGGKLRENVKARMLDDKVTAEMIPAKRFPRADRSSNAQQAIAVHFRGSLMQNLKIGTGYSMIVMPVAKPIPGPPYGRIRYALEANECQEMTNDWVDDEEIGSLLHVVNELLVKFDVQDLAGVPYVCPLLLAFTFGECIAPKGLFLKLKLGILLRLVDCGRAVSKTRASLLAVGHDTSIVDRLLRYGAGFAPRVLPLSMESQLKVTRSQRKASGSHFVDGNAILLASTGVCYLGDLGKFSSTAKRTVANILNTCSVSVDTSNSNVRNNASMDVTSSHPLECQLWAYIDPPYTDADNALLASKTSKSGIPKYLLDAFGLVYYVDTESLTESRQLDDAYLDLVSRRHLDAEFAVSDTEFAKILQTCRERKVTFDPRAEVLIQEYFVVSRRIRGHEEQSTPLPMSAILALTWTAESIAKLNFREVVTEEDSIMAIYLYEECLTIRCGMSFLHVRPLRHLFGNDVRAHLIEILTDLDRFGVLLRRHIASSYTDKGRHAVEE